MPAVLLDAAGRPRSPATCPDTTPAARHATEASAARPTRPRSPRSSPPCATPAPVCTRRACARSSSCCGAGLRIRKALALGEADLDARRGSLLVRRGKGGRRREVGMDRLGMRAATAVAHGANRPCRRSPAVHRQRPDPRRAWSAGAARAELRHAAARAGVRRRFAPHQLRHAHAVEMAREGVPLIVIRRQVAHQPWHHLDLSAGHRQHRDHRDCARPSAADGPGRRDASPVTAQRRAAGPRPRQQ